MKFAFLRESTVERPIDNSELIRTIRKADIAEHNVFVDDLDTSDGLKELLEMLEPKDVLLVRSMVDLAGNINALTKVMLYLQEKKVLVHSIEEDRLNGRFVYSNFKQIRSIVGYYSEIARKKGYEEALKAKKVGRPRLSEQTDKGLRMYLTGKFTIDEICGENGVGISKATLFRAVKEYKEDLKRKLDANNKSI